MSALFSTQRLELHPPAMSDLDFLHTVYGDPKMMTLLGGAFSKEKVEQRLQYWFRHWKSFGFGIGVVRLKSTGEAVGTSGLFYNEFEGEKLCLKWAGW
jgi:RimJ/RimL family protein N-acetyltransferase